MKGAGPISPVEKDDAASPDVECELGRACLARGDRAGATKHALGALSGGGHDFGVLLRAGLLLVEAGRIVEAREVCGIAEGVASCAVPASSDALFLARLMFALRDWGACRDRLEGYLAGHPEDDGAKELFAVVNAELSRAEVGRSERADAFPQCLIVDPTDRCNARCVMCGRNYRAEPVLTNDLSLVTFAKLTKFLPGASQVNLYAVGEPFLATAFNAILAETLKWTRSDARVFVSTNGKAVARERVEALRAQQVVFQISVDGGTPEVFESIRRGVRFDELLKTLFIVDEIRGNGPYPTFVFAVTVSKRNLRDLPAIFAMARRHRADSVLLNPVVPPESEKHTALDEYDADLFEKMRPELDAVGVPYQADLLFARRAELDGASASSPAPETGEAPPSTLPPGGCAAPWRIFCLQANGDVTPCCVLGGEVMGNLIAQDFDDVWNGPAYMALRRSFATETGLHPACRICTHPMRWFGEPR